MTSTEIETKKVRSKREAAVVPAVDDTAAMIAAITKASRDPDVNIETMQFLLDTRRSLLNEQSEQEYRDAMTLAQAEMEPISKDLENPQTRSKYSSLAALDRAIRPIYTKYGFAVTFDTEPWPEPNNILVVCYVERGRHSRRHQVPMPCDTKGPRGNDVMTKTHATGSAVSYGRRYTLCMGFNLITADDDGNRAGGYMPPRTNYPDEPPAEPKARAEHTRRAIAQAQASAPKGAASSALASSLMPITKEELAELKELMVSAGVGLTGEEVLTDHFEVERLEDLTHVQFTVASNQLKARAEEIEKNADQ
jgi:ERF superfamily